MTTERKLLFHVAFGERAESHGSPVPMTQVQPHPKRLDGTKRVRTSWILLDGAHDFCTTRTAPIGKSFVEAKLPYILTDGVAFLCETTVLISSPLHCSWSFLMLRCREWQEFTRR